MPSGMYYDKKTDSYLHVGTQVEYPHDAVIDNVVKRIAKRADVGLSKYGTSMENNNGTAVYWLDHAIEEALDLAAYLTKLKMILKGETV